MSLYLIAVAWMVCLSIPGQAAGIKLAAGSHTCGIANDGLVYC